MQIQKIAFYFQNKNFGGVDCRNLEKGNPGMGGTEYSIISLVKTLTSLSTSNYEFILFVDINILLPDNLNIYVVADNKSLFEEAALQNIDVIVLKHSDVFLKDGALNLTDIRVIIWAHNFVQRSSLNYYSKLKNVVRLVCVSNEQLDLYRDHQAFLKSSAIYNGFFTNSLSNDFDKKNEFLARPNSVTYIGSIIPEKGFHLLAKAWKSVLEHYPDATLNVIGSGKLYDRTSKLGSFNIAKDEYEKIFIGYILGDNGDILPSVRFWGVLGQEKNEILLRTKVGVPNPSGSSETFGYTALEMQSFGAMIATARCAGYLETVGPGGILYDDQKDLASGIIELLAKKDNKYTEVKDFIESNFDFAIIAEHWLNLFKALEGKDTFQDPKPLVNLNFKFKWLRELNRKVKNFVPYGNYFIPSILFYESVFLKLGNLVRKK